MGEPRVTFGQYTDPALLILASLGAGPKHGYAMMLDIEAETGRPIGPGTLYAALTRLESAGLVEGLPAVDRRRPYRLTALGATTLAEQLRGLSDFATNGLQRLVENDT
jgi:DNA-binding PadR family transcriptional regulator